MAVDPVLYRTALIDAKSGSMSREWIRYFNQLGGASLTADNTFTGKNAFKKTLTVDLLNSDSVYATGLAAVQIQVQDSQAAVDLWNKSTGAVTPSGGARWRIFADNVGGGGGNLTFGFYDVPNNRVAMGVDNNGLLTAPVGLNLPNPQNITLGAGWLNWNPSITGFGSMVVSAVSVTDAQYLRIGPIVFFKMFLAFNLSGTASSQIIVSTPIPIVGILSTFTVAVHPVSTGAWTPGWGYGDPTANSFRIENAGEGNFPLGNTSLLIEGFYRCS